MGAPLNGAEFGGGSRRAGDQGTPRPQQPRAEEKDQFEQEGGVQVEEGDESKDVPPATTPRQPAETYRGDPIVLKSMSDIMQDLMSANLSDLRVTNIALELGGRKRLKITFGNSNGSKEKGRSIILFEHDQMWSYES